MSQPNGQEHKAIVLCMTPYISQLPAGFTVTHVNTTPEFKFPKSLFPTESINLFYFFHGSWGFCQPWAHCCLCCKNSPPCSFNTHHHASGAPDSHDALVTLLGWRGVAMVISKDNCNIHSPNSANHPTGDNRNCSACRSPDPRRSCPTSSLIPPSGLDALMLLWIWVKEPKGLEIVHMSLQVDTAVFRE